VLGFVVDVYFVSVPFNDYWFVFINFYVFR